MDTGFICCWPFRPPAFLVRLFMIQHDCGHGSFFRHRLVNDWVGRVIGVLTLTPYDFWRRTHAVHHATSGNLELRGIGDIDTLTVSEYLCAVVLAAGCLSPLPASARHVRAWPRLSVRPAAALPFGQMRQGLAALGQHHGDQWRDRAGRCRHDLVGRHRSVSPGASADHASSARRSGCGCSMSSTNSNIPLWSQDRDWRLHDCCALRQLALRSSGRSDAGSRPISASIISIICAAEFRFTDCRLRFASIPISANVGRLTLRQSLACVRLVLWDEAARRLISFRELRTRFGGGAVKYAEVSSRLPHS